MSSVLSSQIRQTGLQWKEHGESKYLKNLLLLYTLHCSLIVQEGSWKKNIANDPKGGYQESNIVRGLEHMIFNEGLWERVWLRGLLSLGKGRIKRPLIAACEIWTETTRTMELTLLSGDFCYDKTQKPQDAAPLQTLNKCPSRIHQEGCAAL